MNIRIGLLLASLLIAGCGGGGSGSTTSAPGSTIPNPPVGSSPQYATLRLTFTASASSQGRRGQYVSPSVSQIEVLVNSVNGGTPPTWVNADQTTVLTTSGGSPNCTLTGGTETCNVPVAAPPGTVNYTFNVKDASNKLLGTVTANESIVQGTNNLISVTLGGVVATVAVTGASLTANTAIATGEVLTVNGLDASGNLIINGATSANYSNPITLTDNDATGQTALTVNGGAASSSVVVNNPSDVVKLTYTGQAANTFTITASGGGGLSGGGTISTAVSDVLFTSGTTLDDAAHGGIPTDANWGQGTVFFAQASGSQNVAASEAGFTNAPYSQLFDISLSAGCAGIASASASPATTFTITATGGAGVCSARLKEHGAGYPITQHTANASGSATHDGTFWISVTTASFTVNGKAHK